MKRPVVGDRFGRWTVISLGAPKVFACGQRAPRFLCVCTCGISRLVVQGDLKSGRSTSCGCLRREQGLKASTTHGFSRHPLSGVFKTMLRRCYDPTYNVYAWYGGRKPQPITICPEWLSDRSVFFKDMLPEYRRGLTIDRRDKEGPYSKDNCRWITIQQQQRNRRSNRPVLFDGRSMCVVEAAELLGMCRHALRKLLNFSKGAAFLIEEHTIHETGFRKQVI